MLDPAIIGNLLTGGALIVTGAVAFGVLKTQVASMRDTQKMLKTTLDATEERLRDVEKVKMLWEGHVGQAPDVLGRLRAIESSMAELRTELKNRDETIAKLYDVLEANRIVLSELGKDVAVIKATVR